MSILHEDYVKVVPSYEVALYKRTLRQQRSATKAALYDTGSSRGN